MSAKQPEQAAAPARTVTLRLDGYPLNARETDTVAAALLGAGCIDFRATPVSGTPRGPYCMMGVCYDCLVTIDGKPNQQACMTLVREGMRVERQRGARTVVAADAKPAAR